MSVGVLTSLCAYDEPFYRLIRMWTEFTEPKEWVPKVAELFGVFLGKQYESETQKSQVTERSVKYVVFKILTEVFSISNENAGLAAESTWAHVVKWIDLAAQVEEQRELDRSRD